jgi:hypothetical protein
MPTLSPGTSTPQAPAIIPATDDATGPLHARRTWRGTRGTIGRQLRAEELGKVRAELGNYQQFAALAEQIAEVSEAICEARPVPAHAGQAPDPEGQKRGSAISSPRSSRRTPPPR